MIALLGLFIISLSSIVLGVGTSTAIVVGLIAAVFVFGMVAPRLARVVGALAGAIVAIVLFARVPAATDDSCEPPTRDGIYVPGLHELSDHLATSDCRAASRAAGRARARYELATGVATAIALAGSIALTRPQDA